MTSPLTLTLTLDQLRTDVADVLGEDPADIPADENLVDYGLDSVRLMTLLNRWRRDHGVTASFADLAEEPALEKWVPLLTREG
ncbi:isochorismatase [Streptomyces sp. BG9H]|uniref:Isochorismatase n=1 Tax=Streptomyces anatolicus TaxID=2675858 RepID=A0ABS6YWW4_9ACTN|nr:phosphopantetheine-binding protein [Streptomyces anatolicus]MBW5425920.1 isochorismatase [Streptomyces anatolicus]